MGTQYTHLNIEERCQIARIHAEGYTLRHIAATLDRKPSAISQELNRNGSKTLGYQPLYADKQARARRWRGSNLGRDPDLRHTMLARLKLGSSPGQIAGRLNRDRAKRRVSHETIYRFIYAQMARKKDYTWATTCPLPYRSAADRWKGRLPASFIALRRPLSERPLAAVGRRTPGHWEAILTLHELHLRLVLATWTPGKIPAPIANAIKGLVGGLPPPWRQTMTFYNGTEFARHYHLHVQCESTSPLSQE